MSFYFDKMGCSKIEKERSIMENQCVQKNERDSVVSLTIIGRDWEVEASSRDGSGRLKNVAVSTANAEVIGESLANLSDALSQTFQHIKAVGDYTLDEVTVSVEISASGKVAILGTGAEVSGKGGVQLKFRRSTL
jgi:hypothetical protein